MKIDSDTDEAVVVTPAARAADATGEGDAGWPGSSSPVASSMPESEFPPPDDSFRDWKPRRRQRQRTGGSGGGAPRTPRSGASLDNKRIVATAPLEQILDNKRIVATAPLEQILEQLGIPDYRGHVLPPVELTWSAWKTAVADHLVAVAEQLPYGKTRRSLQRKATAFRLCGTRTRILVCQNCKEPKLSSGIQTSAGHPCQARICSCCQRRNSQARRGDLADALQRLDRRPDFGFKHVTITLRYDPCDASEFTVDALRAKVEGLTKAIKAAWKSGLRRKGTGLSFTIEIAGSGHVHAHLLYYGPYIPKLWLEGALRDAHPRAGFTHIRDVSGENSLFEVAKYHTKAPSPLRESWFEQRLDVINPVLAARWEVATTGVHLHGTLGAFRRRKKPVDACDDDSSRDDSEPRLDENGPCGACGACAGFVEREVDTLEWVRRCHAAGATAFRATRGRAPRAPGDTGGNRTRVPGDTGGNRTAEPPTVPPREVFVV